MFTMTRYTIPMNTATEIVICQWFAMCDQEADRLIIFPILGDIPTCARCAEKLGLS